ncbi:MAG: type II toxin-antitoxin system VapC family toxin [Candidatus Heimdallarchaeota archaeon]
MFCLDSDFLIALLRNDQAAINLLHELESKALLLATTPIQAMELLRGAYKSTKSQENIKRINTLLKSLAILSIDLAVADRYAQLQTSLLKDGQIIGDFDLIIAAISLVHGAQLVTRNINHFERITGLALKAW